MKNSSNQQGSRKAPSKKYDYTSTKRGQKRTALDNAWAQKVSAGKYKTLRNLMRAIHAGEYALVETRPTKRAADALRCEEEGCNEPAVMFYCEDHAP